MMRKSNRKKVRGEKFDDEAGKGEGDVSEG